MIGGRLILTALLLSTLSTRANEVVVWGDNGNNQNTVPGDLGSDIIGIAAGDGHCLALNTNGNVFAWGRGGNKQVRIPAEFTNGTSFAISVAAGGERSLALRSDGTVVLWGASSLGTSNFFGRIDNIVQVRAGNTSLIALRGDGTVIASGIRRMPLDLTNIVAVSIGAGHALALRPDGTVMGWGANQFGEANGIPGVPPFYTTGTVVRLSGQVLTNVISIAAGLDHSLALLADGTARAWGFNNQGQTNVPADLTNAVAIAAGHRHSAALRSDGTVVRWGANPLGMLTVPSTLSNVVAIAAGATNIMALVGDGSPVFTRRLISPQTISAGATVSLSVAATGARPITYQWYLDGAEMTSETNTSLSLGNFQMNQAGTYTVVATNSFGGASSSTVLQPVPIWVWGNDVQRQRRIPAELTNPTALAAGGGHYLALKPNGSVVRWGKTSTGLTNVPGINNAIAVAAGGDHSLVVRTDGSVIAWGQNMDGQTNAPSSASNVIAVAAGSVHSVALRADGTALAWGRNDLGQTEVSFLATEVKAIAAGYSHTLALRADGTVACWGSVDAVPLEATNVVAIAAGFQHSLALRADGSVVAWGDNTLGQTNVPPEATNIVAIASGWYHNVACRSDGTLLGWGGGMPGVIALPTALPNLVGLLAAEDDSLALVGAGPPVFGRQLASAWSSAGGVAVLRPNFTGSLPTSFQWYRDGVAVEGATNRDLLLTGIQTSAEGNYVLWATNASGIASSDAIALDVDPNPSTLVTVGAWGDDRTGQASVPSAVVNPQAIAAGPFHNLVLNGDGTVVAWGNGVNGQTNVSAAATNVIAIAAGLVHSLALRADGTVAAWGYNDLGQVLGFPTTNAAAGVNRHTTNGLVTLNSVVLSNAIAIAAGSAHSLALLSNGTVVAWGNNQYGQTDIPSGLDHVTAIAAGYYNNLALRSDRSVVAWGADNFVPASATNVVSIDAGWGHNLALRAGGKVVAWGDNLYGQSSVPDSATNIIAIAAGWYHSLALRADGTAIAWGQGYFGATSFPSFTDNLLAIAAGDQHSLVLRATGPPLMGSMPDTVAVHVGEEIVLGTPVNGSRPLAIHWLHDDVAIPGATQSWLRVANAQSSDAGNYVLVASNAFGQISHAPVNVTVLDAPAVAGPVQNLAAMIGRPFCINTAASGANPLAFEWYRDGVKVENGGRVSGADTLSLCFSPAEYSDNGMYSLVASNSFGCVTGVVARLSVSPVLAWGNNSFGQLTIPFEATNIVAVSAGDDHCLALRADGRVVAWGDNFFGQCSVPPTLSEVVAIAAGAGHNLALRQDGTVVAWGSNTNLACDVPASLSNAIAIAAGDSHSLALQSDGNVVGWGAPPSSGFSPFVNYVPEAATNVIAIASGDFQDLVLRNDGALVSWGVDIAPIPAEATNIVAIAAGGAHNAALRADGRLFLWGRNAYAQTNVPGDLANTLTVVAGGDYNVALGSDGTARGWGANYYRQIDIPLSATNLLAIRAGGAHGLALDRSGQPYLSLSTFTNTVMLGNQAILRAGNTGNGLASYQWQLDGTNILDATNATLVLGNVGWLNRGIYRLIVSNALGSTTSSPVSLAVIRTPLVFSGMQFTNGNFQVRLTGASGTGPLVLLSSPDVTADLQTWQPVLTNTPVIGPVELTVPTPAPPTGFFRATEPESP